MNYKSILIALSILFVLPFSADAQRWKRYRWESVYGIGISNFLGELGGADQVGTDYFKDLEMVSTRPAANIGLRYKFTQLTALKLGFTWGMIAGDDALTTEEHRSNRSLNFRSHIFELAAQYEFYFKKEKRGHRYKLRGVRGIKAAGMYPYAFFGVAGFYFNPFGKVDGKWTNLPRLGTEGQRVPGSGRAPYSRFQLAVPIGLGLKYRLDKRWLLGIEYGLRKTFTDYVDDVSTTYYPNSKIESTTGQTAAKAADPTGGAWIGSADYQQRGDPTDNDSYMFLLITLNYKIKTTRGGLPKWGR